MAITPIPMPKWGLAMEEGTVTEWLKAEGDLISGGDEIVEIETSKITNVMEAQEGGKLRRIVAPVGETLPVGALIAVMAEDSDADADIDAFVADFQARFETEKDAGGEASGPDTVEIDGQTIVYEEQGSGDGAPLILVHGFGGDRNNWLFNQDALSAERRILLLDLPGHGGSTKSINDPSLKGLANVVTAFAAAVGLERYHLMGHSMGAAVCLAAAQQSSAVASVFAVCPAGLAAKVNSDFIDQFIDAERRKGMKQAALMLFANKDLVTRDLVNDLLKVKRLDGVTQALTALRDGAIADGNSGPISVCDIDVPVFVVTADHDEVISSLGSNVKGADVLQVPVGHMAHMEAAAEVNEQAAGFFAAND